MDPTSPRRFGSMETVACSPLESTDLIGWTTELGALSPRPTFHHKDTCTTGINRLDDHGTLHVKFLWSICFIRCTMWSLMLWREALCIDVWIYATPIFVNCAYAYSAHLAFSTLFSAGLMVGKGSGDQCAHGFHESLVACSDLKDDFCELADVERIMKEGACGTLGSFDACCNSFFQWWS